MEIDMAHINRSVKRTKTLLVMLVSIGLGACTTIHPNEPMTPERLAQIRSTHEPRGWLYLPELASPTHAHFIEPASMQREGPRVIYRILRIPAKPSFGGVGLGAMLARQQVDCSARTLQLLSIEGFRDELATQPATRDEQARPERRVQADAPNQRMLDKVCALASR
jgi:hypothetical protein